MTIRCHHVASLTIYLVSTASLQLFLMLPKLMVTELLCRAHVGRHMTEQALGLSSLNRSVICSAPMAASALLAAG